MASVTQTQTASVGAQSRRQFVRRGGSWSPEPSPRTGAVLAGPFIIVLLVYVIYPFVRLIQTAVGPPRGLGNVQVFFANAANLNVIAVTFRDAALVTAILFVFGGLLAWSLRWTQGRVMRTVLLSAIFVPFWMGSVVKIYALSVLLGRAGIINSILQDLHLTTAPLPLLYTQTAVIAGMVYQLLPIAALPLFVAFSSIDSDLLLAAESLGASRIRSIANVAIPLAMPGILATLIINFVISLGFYLTPVLLGGATQPFTASLIQEDLFSYFDLAGAAIGGLVLLVGGALAVVAGYFLVGKERLRRAIGA